MIRVAIVEDDAEVQGVLQEYVRRYTRQYGTEFEVTVFADGVDILEDYRAVYDIIFLDVEMKHLDGMTTAERIRQMDADVILIFITNMAQYAIRGYSVGALDYVLKPVPLLCLFAAAAQGRCPAGKAGKALPHCAGGGRAAAAGHRKHLLSGKRGSPGALLHRRGRFFRPRCPSRPLRKSWQTAPLPAATAATLSIWHRCGSCGRAPCRWGPCELQVSRPKRKSFLAALTDYIGGEGS